MDNLKTSFGKIKVDEKRKTSLVQDIFTEVSNNYDLMNEPTGMVIDSTGLISWTPLEGIESSGAVTVVVTDGGEDSSTIFKENGIEVQETINVKDLVGIEKQIELLNISGDIFVESSLLIGINNTNVDTTDLNTACLSEIIEFSDVIGLGGSRTNDGGFGVLSKMGLDIFAG